MVHKSQRRGGMTRRWILRALALAAAAPGGPASAYELRTDPSGSPVRFAQRVVVFRLPARLPSGLEPAEVQQALERSLAVWSAISGLDLRSEPGSADAAAGYDSAGQNHNDILFAQDHWPWDNNAVAVTLMTVDARAHTVLDADIVLNARQRRFKNLDGEAAGGAYDDLQNVLTHELGHALGLGHSACPDAAMYAQTTRGEVRKRTLTSDDDDGVRALYPGAPRAPRREAEAAREGSPPAAGAPADALEALSELPSRLRRSCRR